MDGVCVGEGEGPLVDLANSLDDNGSGRKRYPDPGIANWWFKLDGEIVRNDGNP